MSINRIDNIILTGYTNDEITYPNDYFTVNSVTGELKYWTNYIFSWRDLGFTEGQLISLDFLDTSPTGETYNTNYDNYTINRITNYSLFLNTGSTLFDFNTSGKTFYYTIKTQPMTLAQFTLYGETEIEDIRLDKHLKMLGVHITENEEKIFRESDIDEYGIDYRLLNRKRKEMLEIFPTIYNYISSYKALINAINFFGYSDLELYEYYRNIQVSSPQYNKIFKKLIPDIFDKTSDGWRETDYIKDVGDDINYRKTNLFNLTYRITDEDGNNVNMYSLDEVQIKLKSLVKWLRRYIMPVSTNIKDITGVGATVGMIYKNYESGNRVKEFVVERSVPVVNYNMYSTLNFNSNYLVHIDFYETNSGYTIDNFTVKIKTFQKVNCKLIPVQYFNLYKIDLSSFRFNIDSQIDPYIYIEVTYFSENGLGYCNNTLQYFDERRNYMLVNNMFKYKYVPYVSNLITSKNKYDSNGNINDDTILSGDICYLIDDDGNFWVISQRFIREYYLMQQQEIGTCTNINSNCLTLENSGYILLEDGSKIRM